MLFSRSRDAPSLLLHPQGMNQPIAEGTVIVMVGRVFSPPRILEGLNHPQGLVEPQSMGLL